MSDDDIGDLAQYDREELIGALVDCARYGEPDDLEMVKRLIAHDATLVNGQDEQGRTPVHMCCANGHDSVLEILLPHNPDKTVLSAEGCTPLHFAAANGSEKCVKALMDYGYDIAVKNKFGRKAIDDCWEKGFQKVEDMLLLKDPDVEEELKKQQAALSKTDLSGLGEKGLKETSSEGPVAASSSSSSSSTAQPPAGGYSHSSVARPAAAAAPAAESAPAPVAEEVAAASSEKEGEGAAAKEVQSTETAAVDAPAPASPAHLSMMDMD